MRPKLRLVAMLLGAAALFSLSIPFLWPREPVYQGKRLSGWLVELEQLLPSQTPGKSPQPAIDAIRAMGTNAVPHLVAMLRQRDSKLATTLNAWLDKQRWIKARIPLASENHHRAMEGLFFLGTNAFVALPEVSRLTTRSTKQLFAFLTLGAVDRLCTVQGFERVQMSVGNEGPQAQIWEVHADATRYVVFAFAWRGIETFDPKFRSHADLCLFTPQGMVLDRVGLTFTGGAFSWQNEEASGTNCIIFRVSKWRPSPVVTVRHGREVHQVQARANAGLASESDDGFNSFAGTRGLVSSNSLWHSYTDDPVPEELTAVEVRFQIQNKRFVILDPGGAKTPTNLAKPISSSR